MKPWTLALLFAGILSLPSWGAELSCDALNSRWADKLHGDFKVEWARNRFSCPDHRDYRVAKALSDLHDVDPKHQFYDTAKKLVRKVLIAKDCGEDEGARMNSRGEMSLCQGFFARSEPKRAAMIFHEAAHGRRGDPDHVTCSRGDMRGKIACDDEFTGDYSGGAYNWEVQYSTFAMQNAGDDLTRWAMEAHMKYLLHNRFNRISGEDIRRWSR